MAGWNPSESTEEATLRLLNRFYVSPRLRIRLWSAPLPGVAQTAADLAYTSVVLAPSDDVRRGDRLGAVPFFFLDGTDTKYAGPANALACGVMLAASFDLLHEAQPYGGLETILGMAAGAAFIKASQEFLHQHQDLSFANISGADARKTMLIVRIIPPPHGDVVRSGGTDWVEGEGSGCCNREGCYRAV